MSKPFSLNDHDVIRMVDEAKNTQNVDLLRGHVYQLAKLRTEMANRINLEQRNRRDFERIASSVSELPAAGEAKGLGGFLSKSLAFLLDRKGTLASLRKQLEEQIQANYAFASELSQLRLNSDPATRNEAQRLAAALQDAQAEITHLKARSADYEARLSALPHIQAELQQERSNALQLQARLNELLDQPERASGDREAEIQALETQLSQERQTVQQLQVQLTELQNQPDSATADRQAEIDDLRAQLAKAQLDASLQLSAPSAPVTHLAEIEHLQERLSAAQQRITELEQARLDAPAAAASSNDADMVRELFNSQFAGVISDKLRLERLASEQQEKIRNAEFSISQLQSENQAHQRAIAEGEQTLAQLQARIEAEAENSLQLRQRETALLEEVAALQSSIEHKRGLIAQLEQDVQDRGRRHHDALQQIEQLQMDIHSLEAGKKSLADVLTSTQGQLRRSLDDKQALEARVQDQANTIGSLHQSNDRLEQELRQARSEVERLNLQRQDLEAQRQLLDAERDSLGKALLTANARVTELTTEADQLKSRVSELQLRNSHLTETIDQSQVELQRLIQATEADMREQQAEQARLSHQLQDQQARLQQLEQELGQRDNEIDRLNQRSEALVVSLRNAQKDRNLYRTQATEIALELRMANQEAAALRDQLQAAERTNNSLTDELKTSKKVITLSHPLAPQASSPATQEEGSEHTSRSL